jgi:endonuclease/exonuclease/phosphatase family metal-dependent hydrolase
MTHTQPFRQRLAAALGAVIVPLATVVALPGDAEAVTTIKAPWSKVAPSKVPGDPRGVVVTCRDQGTVSGAYNPGRGFTNGYVSVRMCLKYYRTPAGSYYYQGVLELKYHELWSGASDVFAGRSMSVLGSIGLATGIGDCPSISWSDGDVAWCYSPKQILKGGGQELYAKGNVIDFSGRGSPVWSPITTTAAPAPPEANPSVPAGRVMTWNIEGKVRNANTKVDAWAKWIAAYRPDVIGLQETCHRTSATLITRRLRDYGLRYYSASGPAPGTSFPVYNANCGKESGFKASNTILSLSPITAVKNKPLGRTCKPFVGRICRKDLVGRNVLSVTTTVAGRSVRVFDTHIGNGLPSTQKEQVDKVVGDAARFPQAIIVGDFNVEPSSLVLASLAAGGFVDVDSQRNTKTFPATDKDGKKKRSPNKKIDYIFLKGLQPTSSAVVPDTGLASDHRPLYAEIR